MSYYIYIKNDKENCAYYYAPASVTKPFDTIEAAELFARKEIQEMYDNCHDLKLHPKLTTDFNVFRCWIVDAEAVAQSYRQQYVQSDWKPGMDFAWQHIVRKVKDIYPSNSIDNKKAIVKKFKVEFKTDPKILKIFDNRRLEAHNKSAKKDQDYCNSHTFKMAQFVNQANVDVNGIRDEYAFIMPARGQWCNNIKKHGNQTMASGKGYVLVHLKYAPHQYPRGQIVWFFDVDFYEKFKDLSSLNLVASVNGWEPITCNWRFMVNWKKGEYWHGSHYFTKPEIKYVIDNLEQINKDHAEDMERAA